MDATPTSLYPSNTLDPTSIHYTEFLLQCMQDRLEVLHALHSVTNSQMQVAVHGEVDTTLGLLASKQSLIDELTMVQQRLHPYFNDDPEARVWQSPQRHDQCRQLAAEGGRLLQEIIHLEKNALEEISGRREAIAAQLQDGQDSILARTAYAADNLLATSTLDVGNL
ncbi:MAG: hypothetical protein KDA45_13350 [Planctomycetales bacterium]|nr:hypothetical protein [Planctomycetales bacterium]